MPWNRHNSGRYVYSVHDQICLKVVSALESKLYGWSGEGGGGQQDVLQASKSKCLKWASSYIYMFTVKRRFLGKYLYEKIKTV